MGSIVTSGVGSGLDIAGLVQQLVQAEGGAKTLRLNAEEAKVQAKLSALGTLRSALASFRDTVTKLTDIAKFQGRQVTLSDEGFVAATASGAAVPGSYLITVQQLATAHRLQSAPNAYASAATPVGTGTLNIAIGAESFDVVIDSSNNTLAGIAAAINASAAGAKVQATVLNGATEARLTIAARTIGVASEMNVTQTGGDGNLAGLVGGLVEIEGALDAQAEIDGISVTSTTNTLTGAIDGVDITLMAEHGGGAPTAIAVGYDRTAARATIDQLVKSYNAVVDAIKNVSGYNVESKQGGPLFGDAGVRNIVYQLRRELTANVAGLSGPFDVLNKIGVTADLSGKLSVDGTKLDAAFTADFDAVGELFAAENVGVAVRLDKILAPYLDSDGVFDSRTASLKSSIEDINDRREALNARLAGLQARYTKQFNGLDSLLSQLQSTSNFLNQQLSQLPGSAVMLRNRR
jgi:flagellar hook-associated protein 2